MPNHDTHWNHAHLLALALLPLYALLALHAAWSPFATLAIHLFATLAWFGAFERWRPHRAAWRASAADLRRDGVFFGLNAIADGLAGLAVTTVFVLLTQPGPAATLPLWAAVPLAVLASEFAAYWLHRAMHAGGWGWRVHAVHHRPEALNVTNNLTTHPLNVALLKAAKLLPLMVLGFSAEAVLAASLFLQLQSFATHANVRGGMGWLNYVIGTAELHRTHHSTRVDEALNFATALPLWDQLFGTYRYQPGVEPRDVGVGSPEAYPAPADIWGLLRYPLWRGGR
jgi:sterol desaturase/sphingolipid hydroxylase (fatty acid hydroxylase superfamily)